MMNSSLCWLTKLWMGLTILDSHVATCFSAGAMASPNDMNMALS